MNTTKNTMRTASVASAYLINGEQWKNTITARQSRYIAYLAPSMTIDPKTTIKEASAIISRLLANKKHEEPKPTQKITNLEDIDYKALLTKYHASYKVGTNGNYNDSNGSNARSPLLGDTKAFKKFLTQVMRENFPQVKYSLSVSFRGYPEYNALLTLEAPKAELFGDFAHFIENAEINEDYIKWDGWFRNINEMSDAGQKAIFDYGITNMEIKSPKYLAKGYKALFGFLSDLLQSFTYDHSDIQTDYFDHGYNFAVQAYATDADPHALAKLEGLYNATTEADFMEALGLTSQLDEATQKALKERSRKNLEELKKREAIMARNNEEAKARQEAEAKAEERLNDNFIAIFPDKPETLSGCLFSSWNKPTTLDEAKKFLDEQGLESSKGTFCEIAKIVNITDEEAYKTFCLSLLADHKELLKAKDGNGFIGGCAHIDIKTMKELSRDDDEKAGSMSDAEQVARGIGWIRQCVLIRFNGADMFLVDPEGFPYCRYVGFLPKA